MLEVSVILIVGIALAARPARRSCAANMNRRIPGTPRRDSGAGGR